MKRNKIQIAVVIIGLIVFNMATSLVLINVHSNNQDFERKNIQRFDVRVSLKVEFFTQDDVWISLDQDYVEYYNDPVARQEDLIYLFSKDNLGLEANWKAIFINFYIVVEAFNDFRFIEAKFTVENSSDIFDGIDFKLMQGDLPFYHYQHDISNLMWKQEVPQYISAQVGLYQ